MEEIPVLEILTVLIMLMTAYAHSREGLFGAAMMFINVLLAGFLAFNFFEFIVSSMGLVPGGLMDRYADAVCLVLLFCFLLGILRMVVNNVVPNDIMMHPLVKQIGGGVFGLATGYILSGILISMLHTLPWHEQFLWHNPDKGMSLGGPDKVWLATMHRASGQVFDYTNASWFDADGSFISRYARYKRYNDHRDPLPNQGDFPSSLPTQKREPVEPSTP